MQMCMSMFICLSGRAYIFVIFYVWYMLRTHLSITITISCSTIQCVTYTMQTVTAL